MKRPNPYGVHYIPTHQRREHYDHIRASAPGLVKLVSDNGAPDVQQMADAYAAAPHAIHVYRNHPLSEQHDALWRDPVGTAVRHASTWQAEMRTRRDQAKRRGLTLPPMEQTSVLSINEPVIELFPRQENMSNYDEWLAMMHQRTGLLDLFLSTWVWECVKYGQPCHVGNFSGGQPANLKPGDYATYEWFPKTRAAMEATRGMTALSVHEYWDVPGPLENVDWWTFRFFHCEWDIDTIDVLECGVDRAIRSQQYEGTRGYSGHLTGPQYAEQIATYMLGCLRDDRFRCATPFTMDGDKIWESFWIDPILREMIGVSSEMQRVVYEETPKPIHDGDSVSQDNHKAHVPIVTVGTPPQAPTGAPEQPQPEPQPAGIIDPLTALAFLQVESGNQPFMDGLLTIRFEVHRFEDFLGNQALFDRHFYYVPKQYNEQYWRTSPSAPWRHAHGSMAQRHELLRFARGLDDTAALNSTGMGMAQIMGHNAKRVGFGTPQRMFAAFSDARYGVNAQLMGFVNYVLSDGRLAGALRQGDWHTAIQLYNGIGQEAEYTRRLNEALREIRGAVGG